MKQFEPRPYQKEMFDRIASMPRKTLIQLPSRRSYVYGIDFAEKEGDRTAVVSGKMNGAHITHVVMDEYDYMPIHKSKYYNHFSDKHLRINDKIIIFGLTQLEYFDLKTKKIVKWKKYGRAK